MASNRSCGPCTKRGREFGIPKDIREPEGSAIFAAHFAVEHPDLWESFEDEGLANRYVNALWKANKRR